MYTTSDDFKTAINNPSRKFECQITCGDKTYTNINIVSINIAGSLQPSGYTIGSVISQKATFKFINDGTVTFPSDTISLKIGLYVGSAYEYIPIGSYILDSYDSDDYTITITAYDNMVKLEGKYNGTGTTLQAIAQEICTSCGVDLGSAIPSTTVTALARGKYTNREVIGYIAGCMCGNAVIDREGEIKIQGLDLATINKQITADNWFTYKNTDTAFDIDKIICDTGNTKITSGTTTDETKTLIIKNPLITQTMLDSALTELSEVTFTGFNVKYQGDISTDLGDTVKITDRKGQTLTAPLLQRTINYNGGLTENIRTEAKKKIGFASSYYSNGRYSLDLDKYKYDLEKYKTSGSGITQDDLDTALEDYVKTDDFDDYKEEQAKKDAKSGDNLLINGDFKYFQYCEDGFTSRSDLLYGYYKIYGWDTNEISSAVRGREIVRDGGIDGGECIRLPGLSGQDIQQVVDLSDTDSEYVYIRGFMKEEDTELDNNYPFIFDFYAEVGEKKTSLGDTVVWHPTNDRINNTSYYIYPTAYKDGWYKYERTYKIPEGAACMRLLIEGKKRKVYIDKLEVKVTSDGTDYTPSFGDKKLATNTSRKTLMFTSAMWEDDTTNTDWKSIEFDNPFSTKNVTCTFTNDTEDCRELVKYVVTDSKITCFNDRAFDGHILIINEEGD